jgi:hypothetical protein
LARIEPYDAGGVILYLNEAAVDKIAVGEAVALLARVATITLIPMFGTGELIEQRAAESLSLDGGPVFTETDKNDVKTQFLVLKAVKLIVRTINERVIVFSDGYAKSSGIDPHPSLWP